MTPAGARDQRLDTAAFAAGGNACKPRADCGHQEQRSPSTSVATDARG
jgi:hypothetical protein